MTKLLPPKALDQFDKWLTAYNVTDWEKLPDFVQLAYYVKWLDEQPNMVIVSAKNYFNENYKVIIALSEGDYKFYGTTRTEALTAAVIKAGEIIEGRLT